VTPAEGSPAFLDNGLSDFNRRDLLTRIDAYCDAAPRATARAEEYGSLVLFVAQRGWPFYARPGLTRSAEPTVDEIREVLARQSELKVPLAVEWVHDTAPSLAESAREAGLTVHECPLLALGSLVEPRPAEGWVRLIGAEDDDLETIQAAIGVGFDTPGTAVADAGVAERDGAATLADHERVDFTRDMIRAGRSVLVGAFVDGIGPVGGGSHNPRGQVSEIVGVGVLPAFRRRGLAGAVAQLLARQALDSAVTTVFCGAESIDVARVYERLGFRRIGTTCIASPR